MASTGDTLYLSLYKKSVPTSQITHCLPITSGGILMLLGMQSPFFLANIPNIMNRGL
jgi:hypothetical protein